jgi:hypothetical protein
MLRTTGYAVLVSFKPLLSVTLSALLLGLGFTRIYSVMISPFYLTFVTLFYIVEIIVLTLQAIPVFKTLTKDLRIFNSARFMRRTKITTIVGRILAIEASFLKVLSLVMLGLKLVSLIAHFGFLVYWLVLSLIVSFAFYDMVIARFLFIASLTGRILVMLLNSFALRFIGTLLKFFILLGHILFLPFPFLMRLQIVSIETFFAFVRLLVSRFNRATHAGKFWNEFLLYR